MKSAAAEAERRQGAQGDADRSTSTRRTSTSTWACAATRSASPRRRTRSARSPGLAWTEVGGDLLTIEAVALPGKGKTTTTGKLGDVMKESIAGRAVGGAPPLEAARHPGGLLSEDRHAHPPARRRDAEGRPVARASAIATAMVSMLTGIPVRCRRRDDRRDHAARRSAADRRAEGEAACGAIAAASRRC